MTGVILFRFHRAFDVCRERLRILRHYNPNLPVLAIYGGSSSDCFAAMREVGPLVDDLQILPIDDNHWKWLHADFAIKLWFQRFGHRLRFDFIFDYEWDLLLAAPMVELYPQLSERAVILSGLERMSDIEGFWQWTSQEPHREEFLRYCDYMRENHGLERQTWASQGPAAVYPRKFFEEFSKIDHPGEIFDCMMSEITYPGFAEALGFELRNTGFMPAWTTPEGHAAGADVFNCYGSRIPIRTIGRELGTPKGRRTFHPVDYFLTIEDLQWFEELRQKGRSKTY